MVGNSYLPDNLMEDEAIQSILKEDDDDEMTAVKDKLRAKFEDR